MRYWMVLLITLLPLFAMSEENAPDSDYILVAQEMIHNRDFLQKNSLERMQIFTTNLTDDSKEALYCENKKNRNLGWFSVLVPTLGNWIERDIFGGVVSSVGLLGGCWALAYGSTRTDGPVITTTNGAGTSDYHITTTYTGSITSTGIAVMVIGGVIMLASEIFSTASALSYADSYNSKLKSGLSIAYAVPINYYALNSRKEFSDLFYISLVSCRF